MIQFEQTLDMLYVIFNKHFAFSRFDSKLYIYKPFSMSYFLYDKKMLPGLGRSMGKDNEFEYNFVKICRYLNLVKKSEDNFRKFKIYNLLQH